jgi:hypothetical protein
MSRFAQWLDHRMEVIGIENRKDLSEFTGISLESIQRIALHSLDVSSRSQQRALAAVLRVPVRSLERLSRGELDWINDDYFYDAFDRGSVPPGHDDGAYWLPKSAPPEDRGTPLIGTIHCNGKADPDEDWNEEWGRRLPARFGRGLDIYALELEGTGSSIVFRNGPVWQFRGGQAAVYLWNGWEAVGWYGSVNIQSSRPYVVTPDGFRRDLDAAAIMRIGRVIGRWPPGFANVA